MDVLCRQCSPLRASTPVEEHQRGIVPAVGPELLYLLIGAGLAMAAQAIIQLGTYFQQWMGSCRHASVLNDAVLPKVTS